MSTQNDIRSSINSTFDANQSITSVTWVIEKNHISKFKALPNGSYVTSDTFASDQNIKWYLTCYPNGHNKNSIGSCIPSLYLSSLPNGIQGITVYYSIYCPQTHSCNETITEFTKSNQGKGWANRFQSTSELLSHSTITFITNIRILKIININNKIEYIHPLKLDTINKEYNIKWNINNNIINTLNKTHYGKSICARLISNNNKMFTMKCYPNGFHKESEGYVGLYLNITSLPEHVHSMKIKYTLKCPIINKSGTHEYTFSYMNNIMGFYDFCKSNLFLNNINISIMCLIEIESIFDINGNEIKHIFNKNDNKNKNIPELESKQKELDDDQRIKQLEKERAKFEAKQRKLDKERVEFEAEKQRKLNKERAEFEAEKQRKLEHLNINNKEINKEEEDKH